jgi:hypothetical protein
MTELFQDCDEQDRKMFLSAYNTITQMEMWDFIKNYEPPENAGFMFDRNTTIQSIHNKIAENYNNNHSGFSMAFTMRKMQEIAKNK